MGARRTLSYVGVYPLIRVTSSRIDRASTAASPMIPARFCHHLLRMLPMSDLRLAMMMISAARTGATKIVSACAMTISWIGDAWKIRVTTMPKARMLPLTIFAVRELGRRSAAEAVGEHRAAGGRVGDHRRERGAEEPEREDGRSDRSGEGFEDAGEGDDRRRGLAGLAEHRRRDDDHERGHDAGRDDAGDGVDDGDVAVVRLGAAALLRSVGRVEGGVDARSSCRRARRSAATSRPGRRGADRSRRRPSRGWR